MGLINFINKKTTFSQQKRYLKAFAIGSIVGMIISNSLTYFFINKEFNIEKILFNIVFTIVFNIWLASPFIYAYIKNAKKYKKLVDKILIKLNSTSDGIYPKNTNICVKATFDFINISKGEVYDVFIYPRGFRSIGQKWYKSSFLAYIDAPGSNPIEEMINKFDIVDIKEERRRKLKKIQGWF